MTDERYVRILNKLLPIENGDERYAAVRRSGFNRFNDDFDNVHMFRIAYLEHIRYNLTKIEFFLL